MNDSAEQFPAEEAVPAVVEMPDASGVGAMLRAGREARALEVADVARSLRLSSRQVAALEQGDFDLLPGPTFVRGFIRNYARLVHIDPEPVLTAYRDLDHRQAVQVIPDASRQVSLQEKRNHRRAFFEVTRRPWMRYGAALAALAVLVLLLGLAFYEAMRETRRVHTQPALLTQPATPAAERVAAPLAEAPAAAPVEPLPPAPLAPALAEGDLRLSFSGESWVEIHDASGRRLMSAINPAGSEQVVGGQSPYQLVIGNAGAVRLTVRGKPVDLAPHSHLDVARLAVE